MLDIISLISKYYRESSWLFIILSVIMAIFVVLDLNKKVSIQNLVLSNILLTIIVIVSTLQIPVLFSLSAKLNPFIVLILIISPIINSVTIIYILEKIVFIKNKKFDDDNQNIAKLKRTKHLLKSTIIPNILAQTIIILILSSSLKVIAFGFIFILSVWFIFLGIFMSGLGLLLLAIMPIIYATSVLPLSIANIKYIVPSKMHIVAKIVSIYFSFCLGINIIMSVIYIFKINKQIKQEENQLVEQTV